MNRISLKNVWDVLDSCFNKNYVVAWCLTYRIRKHNGMDVRLNTASDCSVFVQKITIRLDTFCITNILQGKLGLFGSIEIPTRVKNSVFAILYLSVFVVLTFIDCTNSVIKPLEFHHKLLKIKAQKHPSTVIMKFVPISTFDWDTHLSGITAVLLLERIFPTEFFL